MRVLAIETSCDETGVAVIEGDGTKPFTIVANAVYSQISLHRQFGGVYPEAASREHVRKIGIVLEESLREAMRFSGTQNSKLKTQNQDENSKKHSQNSKFKIPNSVNLRNYISSQIDVIAVTAGPGLIGSLLVGVNAAKSLAYVFGKPMVAVNHHEGHIAAAWLEPSSGDPKSQVPSTKQIQNSKFKIPELPTLALVVSGGHTMLVLMRGVGEYEILGRTRDDAAGEAFDKTARLLGLPYPGGPEISALAEKISNDKTQMTNKTQNSKLKLPRPMIDSGDLNFSFSGLKTAVARWVELNKPLDEAKKLTLAYEIQEAIVEVLVSKTLQAVEQYQPKSVILTGGVAANRRLRDRITETISQLPTANCQLPVFIPPPSLCTDNGSMIGAAGILKALAGQVQNWYDVTADDSLTLTTK